MKILLISTLTRLRMAARHEHTNKIMNPQFSDTVRVNFQLDMLPSSSVDNVQNRVLANAVILGELALRDLPGIITRTNFSHGISSQYGVLVRLTAKKRFRVPVCAAPPLLCAISHVVFARAKKKMIWIYTGWVIAVVADIRAFRIGDGAVMQFVRNAVRVKWASIYIESAISMIILGAFPIPASIGGNSLVYFLPESFGNRGAILRGSHLKLILSIWLEGHECANTLVSRYPSVYQRCTPYSTREMGCNQ